MPLTTTNRHFRIFS